MSKSTVPDRRRQLHNEHIPKKIYIYPPCTNLTLEKQSHSDRKQYQQVFLWGKQLFTMHSYQRLLFSTLRWKQWPGDVQRMRSFKRLVFVFIMYLCGRKSPLAGCHQRAIVLGCVWERWKEMVEGTRLWLSSTYTVVYCLYLFRPVLIKHSIGPVQ